MTIVAGIDEAGFGPVLGPLVVSAAAFSVPDDRAGESMWRMLSGAVTQRASKRPTRIAIADSKKLYGGLRGAAGLENLERGVLAMLGTRGLLPQSLAGLLEIVCPPAVIEAQRRRWYEGVNISLPRNLSVLEATLAANALDVAMRQADVKLLTIRSEVVFEPEFNRLTQAANKSVVLFDVTCRLLMRLWQTGKKDMLIHVDRHGGRIHYLEPLARAFEGCAFKVIEESADHSAYQMAAGGRTAEIHFHVESERLHMPVALASMTSKYLRELFMRVYNSFWAQQVPGLSPTAGYYADGKRFYQQILPTAETMGIDRQTLYRLR